MSENSSSTHFVRWTARIVAAVGLGFVFVPLIWSWLGNLTNETVELYITGVGVPLLTFAGFLAVYLGFLSQREQNELQKEQLEKQQKDRFERTFYQLLRTHSQIVEDVSCTLSGGFSRGGRKCFEKFYSEFEDLFHRKADEEDWGDFDSAEEGKVRWVYAKWFADRKSVLNHYFSNLSKLISFVDGSNVDDKEFYIGMITDRMSMPEQKLFFYHVNLLKDESGHRHLREAHEVLGEYTFFEQIDRRSLAHDQHYQLNRKALGME